MIEITHNFSEMFTTSVYGFLLEYFKRKFLYHIAKDMHKVMNKEEFFLTVISLSGR